MTKLTQQTFKKHRNFYQWLEETEAELNNVSRDEKKTDEGVAQSTPVVLDVDTLST